MAIEKYATEGLVISLYETGEHDMNVKIFTRDFGMIFAKGASLRRSIKMRSHIMPARLTTVTLVKGKENYRLAGVTEVNKKHVALRYIREGLAKFVQGEQKQNSLYDRLMSYVEIGEVEENILRLCINLDIVIRLGYLDIEQINLSKAEYFDHDVNYFLLRVSTNKVNCLRELSSAIKNSML